MQDRDLVKTCGSVLVSMRIRIQLSISMWIRIQGAKPMRTMRFRIRILVRLCRQKKLNLDMKNTLQAGNKK
jgi:hypothetical protein